MSMTPKQALIKDGTIPVKEGRGRLSREAVDRCKWLVAEKGWDIAGYSVSNTPATTTKAAEKVVKKVNVVNEKVIQDFVILFDEKVYRAIDSEKKEWGMREVCNNCRVSLVQCHCGDSTILGGVKVTIVPR